MGVSDGLADADRPTVERRTSRPLKEPNETPTSRSDVQRAGTTGSPTGRAPSGDRAPIVVCGWESQLRGEVGQVIRYPGERGTRDAHSRHRPGHHPRPARTGSLESRMMRKYHVRFGGGRAETGPRGANSARLPRRFPTRYDLSPAQDHSAGL